MKTCEVPQDDGGLFEGKFKALKYALDDNGNYAEVQSVGWEPETIVLNQAWEEVNEQVDEALANVKSGKWSTLAYHSLKCMMDENLLAEYMGFSKSKVKEHLYNPTTFNTLPMSIKEKYAEVLNIELSELLKV